MRDVTDIRVALIVESIGLDDLDASQLARKQAYRLWAWPHLTEAGFDVDWPEELDNGALRVSVLVGVTDLPPIEAVRGACAVFEDLSWTPERTHHRRASGRLLGSGAAAVERLRPHRGTCSPGSGHDHRVRTPGNARRPRVRAPARHPPHALSSTGISPPGRSTSAPTAAVPFNTAPSRQWLGHRRIRQAESDGGLSPPSTGVVM